MSTTTYPVRAYGALGERLNRWWWPVKLDMSTDDPRAAKLHEPQAGGPVRETEPPGTQPPRVPPPGPQPPGPPPSGGRPRMSAGRIVALVIGILVTLASVVGLAVGGALAWLDEGRRDSAGYITSDQVTLTTAGYALTSESLAIDAGAASIPHRWFGDARIRVQSTDGTPVFVGLANTSDVQRYLSGVAHSTVTDIGPNHATYTEHAGRAPVVPPAALRIWRSQASGPGQQSISWPFEQGDWTLVVMAADGSRGVSVRADAGSNAPVLEWLWIVVLVSAGVAFVIGVALVVLAVVRQPKPGPSPLQGPPGPPSNGSEGRTV
ncbi:hypothetical protein ACWGID_12680 [Kribbella sp. NPDC054772]